MNIKAEYRPIIILLVTIVVVSILMMISFKYFFPIVLGFLIAAIIEPIVKFLETKTKLNRGIFVGIILTLLFFLICYAVIAAITRLTFELGKLIQALPNFSAYYNIIFDKLTISINRFSTQIPEEIVAYLKNNLDQIISTFVTFLSTFYSSLMSKISMLPNFIVKIVAVLIFTFLFSFFLSKDRYNIIRFFKNILPDSLQRQLKSVQLELLISFFRLIKAQVILVLISMFITISGFYMLNVDYALILGLICGILDFLPVFGPSLIFIPWIIICFIIGNIKLALGLFALYLIILGSRQIFQAKLVGKNLGIDPLVALLSIYLGIQFFGFIGLFIGPLVVVVVRALMHTGIIPPLNKKNR
ncbi:MAG TPA: sporulation integral membrane protein YtvI [Thermoanaerobacterales bacterium]|jgi:sporulation integral membrane protein YtvI|nr:sporulation integral membrane protein YtvI [Thermoanaerobacterales bacterium]